MVVIGHHDLQQVVDLAGQIVAFEHFRQVSNPAWEPLDAVRPVMGQHHVDEAEQVESHRRAVDDRGVALDDAPLLELSQSLLQPRRRQAESPGQPGAGCPRITLEMGQEAPIEVVERYPPVLFWRSLAASSTLWFHARPPDHARHLEWVRGETIVMFMN